MRPSLESQTRGFDTREGVNEDDAVSCFATWSFRGLSADGVRKQPRRESRRRDARRGGEAAGQGPARVKA